MPLSIQPAIRPAALALALTLSGGAWAQDTQTDGDAAPETTVPETDTGETTDTPPTGAPASEAPADDTPPPAPQPGGDLATGRSVGEAQGGGPEIYVREEHGDWEVRCLDAPDGQEDPCQLYQRLSDQNGNPTADVNFFDLPAGGEVAAGATVLTPLQTLLTAQVTMSVDGGAPRRYPFSFCDQAGCYSRMGFTAEDIQAFRSGNTATITVVPALAPDQKAELTMSLRGFTAGLAAVEVPNE